MDEIGSSAADGDALRSVTEAAIKEFVARATEEPTRDDLLEWTTQSAVSMFEARIQRLIDAANERRRDRGRTPQAVSTARRDLEKRDRKRVESAVKRYKQETNDLVEARVAELAASADDESWPDYPMPLELSAALVPQLMGSRGGDSFARLIESLSAFGVEGANYGMAYLQWLNSTELPDPAVEALVPAGVAEFEQLLHNLLRIGLLKVPKALALDTKTVSLAELESLEGHSLAIRLMVIDRTIKEHLRGGVHAWDEKLTKWPGLSLRDLTSEWDRFTEVFLRRNVIVHNGGRVDHDYLDKRLGGDPELHIGSVLRCDADYVLTSLRLLRSTGRSLGLLWMPTLSGGDVSLNLSRADDIVYVALEEGRWTDGSTVGSTFLRRAVGSEGTTAHGHLRVNVWMAEREATGSVDAIRDAVEAWQPPDNDAIWPVARAALLMQTDAAAEAITLAVKRGTPSKVFADWPLIKRLGRSPRLMRALAASGASTPPAARRRRR